MEAAQLRGHRVLATTAAGLGFTGGHAMALIRPVRLHPAVLHEGRWLADPQWFTLGPAERYRLNDAAVIFMRTDPPVDAQYLRATYLLDLVDATRTLMINCPVGVRNAKLFALRAPALVLATLVSAHRQQICQTVAEWGRAVLKPTDGMGGRGILVLDPADQNLASILDPESRLDPGYGHRARPVPRRGPAMAAGLRRGRPAGDQLDGEPTGLGTYSVGVAPESVWIFKGVGTHYFQIQLEVGIPQVDSTRSTPALRPSCAGTAA